MAEQLPKPPVVYGKTVHAQRCPECRWHLAFEPYMRQITITSGSYTGTHNRCEWAAYCPNPACDVGQIDPYTEQPYDA